MTILDEILEQKRSEVNRQKRERSVSTLGSYEYFNRATRSLAAPFGDHLPFGIIAEIKRSSPSAGTFAPRMQPAQLAAVYEENGASGISVLTDKAFFDGSLADLESVRRVTGTPLLRKDFIFDEYQLFESKASGADAILLIAAILEKTQLRDLTAGARELGLDCLIELYDAAEINKLDHDSMNFVGINNRNLHTFAVDLNHTFEVRGGLPDTCVVISESGIRSREDIDRLRAAAVHGALIGEGLVRAEHPGALLRMFLRTDNDASPR